MERDKTNFVEPTFLIIFVRELKLEIIAEALEAYASDEEDAFWLKFYYLLAEFTIEDLNKGVS